MEDHIKQKLQDIVDNWIAEASDIAQDIDNCSLEEFSLYWKLRDMVSELQEFIDKY